MNTKKIAISLIASALLTTAAFAAVGTGTLNLSGGSGAVTNEYAEKYGSNQVLNLGNLEYTADILGSGSVSDALIRLDLTETSLKGTTDAGLVGTVIQNKETNETIATFDRKITAGGRTYFLFDGDATKSIVDGQKYHVTNDQNSSVNISYRLTGSTVKLDVYSTSGTEEKRDATSASLSTSKAPQFLVSCVTKFDGLINFEALKDSFVNTTHDNVASDTSDHYGQSDTLIFSIDNNRGAGLYLDGNATSIKFQAKKDRAGRVVNKDNDFSVAADWTGTLTGIKPNGDAYNPGTFTYTESTKDANLTFTLPANEAIVAGKSTYYATLTHKAGGAAISPTYFTNARVYIEEGLADNNNTIAPARNTTNTMDVGAWADYAYIAQIPGATQTATTQTKLFIVNRSCVPVTPKFRLIKDGVVTEVDGVEIKVNSQAKTTLGSLLSSANLAEGQYAVEVILPGIAEDFYVYAQAQGMVDKTITKDLPVYNTSNRD